MRAYLVGERLSEHMAWTPEGFLVCTGVVLCRTGTQQYRRGEIDNSGTNELVTVHRAAQDVLSNLHIASLEAKAVTQGHPPVFLTPSNIAVYQKGHLQNVRVGRLPSGESCLIGDLIITDPTLAEKVAAGTLRQISTGYECQYIDRPDGHFDQVNFLANHVAIVPQARANVGRPPMVRIMDGQKEETMNDEMHEYTAALEKLAGILNFLKARDQATAQQTADSAALRSRFDSASQDALDFANRANELGRRMRSVYDCRPALRERIEVLDAGKKESERPILSAEEDSAAYADSLKRFHRR